MAYIRIEDYYHFKDFIHPRINDCIDHYRNKDITHHPAHHGCNTVNRNGIRKLVNYRRKYQCLCPTNKGYWRKTKVKYRINYVYFTRYIAQYGLQSLAKRFPLGNKFQNIFITDTMGLMAAKWVDEAPINPIMNYLQIDNTQNKY